MNKSRITMLILVNGIPFRKSAAFQADPEAGREEVRCIPNYTKLESDHELDGIGYMEIGHLARIFEEMIFSSGKEKREIAALLGVTPATISRWCAGSFPIPEKAWREVEKISSPRKRKVVKK